MVMDESKFFQKEPITRWMPDDFNAFLVWAAEINASDVNLVPKEPIWIRVYGVWQTASRRPLANDEISIILDTFAGSAAATARISGQEALDFLHEIKLARNYKVRFRVNATACKDGFSSGANMIFRTIPDLPPKLETMNVEPGILKHCFPSNGLVLVCGVMGSGKSTLLASMFREIIEKQSRHVATYEAPIEFDLMGIPEKSGPIIQMEVPKHIESFQEAIRATTRKAQDVVLIGESRDLETLMGLITVSEVGVAAYSTVHTRSVEETPSRIINMFPENLQNQVAVSMYAALRMIIYQRLVKTVDGKRVALRSFLAFEEDIRDELIGNVKNAYSILQKYTRERGQTILQDAQRKHQEGRISDQVLAQLEQEFDKE